MSGEGRRGAAKTALLFAVLTAVLAAAALAYYPPLQGGPPRSAAQGGAWDAVQDGRLDLNTAAAADLQALPGIGEVKAAAIVAYREAHGGFSSVEELLQVRGIGEKLFADLKDHVCI